MRSTRPLALYGRIVKGLEVRFENGRIVDVRAEEGAEVIEGQLNTDERAATRRPHTLPSAEITASVKPSENRSFAVSPLVLRKGSTATDFSPRHCCGSAKAEAH